MRGSTVCISKNIIVSCPSHYRVWSNYILHGTESSKVPKVITPLGFLSHFGKGESGKSRSVGTTYRNHVRQGKSDKVAWRCKWNVERVLIGWFNKGVWMNYRYILLGSPNSHTIIFWCPTFAEKRPKLLTVELLAVSWTFLRLWNRWKVILLTRRLSSFHESWCWPPTLAVLLSQGLPFWPEW